MNGHGGDEMSQNIISHRRAIQNLLKEDQLLDIRQMAIETPLSNIGNTEFLSYQREIIQNAFLGFTYQFCITSTVVSDENMVPQEIECVLLDLPEEIMVSYMNNLEYDELTPVSLLNPGRALSYTEACQDLDVSKHPFFVNHCSKFSIYRGITVGYNYPASRHTFITMDYLGDKDNIGWSKFDHTRLSIASFPFALAWLYRQGRMDIGELSRRFELLADFSEIKLQNLRKFINTPFQSFAEQGEALGIKGNSLRADLNETHKQVRNRFKKYCRPEEMDSMTRMAGLKLHYDFLKMLGDHTQELVRPT